MNKKKKSKGKKILKWVIGIFLILIIGLVSIPFLFKDKIVQMVVNTANNDVNATITFKDSDLSLFTNFPLASVSIEDIAVVNKEPFLGDTLFTAKKLNLSMKITELFKNTGETLELSSISTSDGFINIKINKDNIGNYDIAKKEDTSTEKNSQESNLSLNIKEYTLENIDFLYTDESTKTHLNISQINHTGKGNFAKEILDLDTKTTAKLHLDMEGVNYISNVDVSLDALLAINLKELKYTFKENEGFINQLPLKFDGFIQLVDDKQLYDITFKTPTSSFKNALALLPKQYSGNLKDIKTEGNFDLSGTINGYYSENSIPKLDISLQSKNAMFKYNTLQKAVTNINLDTKIINKTGNTKDTYLSFKTVSFKIDKDIFNASGSLSNITQNPKINLSAKGTINLNNIDKVYPISLEKKLAGVLNADISTSFDMNSIEKRSYQNIKNSGNITVSNFKYDDKDVANPFYISKTAIDFDTSKIQLKEFDAKTGNSDLNITGNLDNFYGFLFDNQKLKGNFNLNSNNLTVADFLTKDTTSTKKKEAKSSLKVPAFLDIILNAKANNVVYDNINLKEVKGTVTLKDETVNLKNLQTNVFGGNIGFDGTVSTKGKKATFSMDLNLNELNITESFSSLEMLKAIAPIAKTIEGQLNSTITISGDLKNDMTPDLNTLTGKLFGQLLNTKLKASNSKTLSLLNNKVSFLDTDKLNLDKLTGYFSFKDGEVTVKPIPLKYKDIAIEIGGKHGFDKSMNYEVNFDVPVKYLGSSVTEAIQKLTPKDASDIKTIPVTANIDGSFSSPNISTNIKSATANLMNTIIEKQKQNLKNQGKDKLKDLLGLTKKKDSAKTDSVKKTKDLVKDKAKDVLKNLFGRKKDTSKKN
ncbi:AsmA-like C-terminal region-containing protein [Polaribacter porphyrae]|nr:AsmA-like C-terminal region-containing protein [Polaribacter porphyrae]